MLLPKGALVTPSTPFNYAPPQEDTVIISISLCNYNRSYTPIDTVDGDGNLISSIIPSIDVDILLMDTNDNVISYFLTTSLLPGETQLIDTKLPLSLNDKLRVQSSGSMSVTLGTANGGLF